MKKSYLISGTIVVLVGFFLIFIFSSKSAKIARVNLPDQESGNLMFGIEKVGDKTISDVNIYEVVQPSKKWFKEVVSISGWVYDSSSDSERDLFIVLDGDENNLVFKVKKSDISRPDLKTGSLGNAKNDAFGFEVFLPLSKLEDDNYRIGFYVKYPSGEGLVYTDQALEISGETIIFGIYRPFSKKVDVEVTTFNRLLKGNVESLALQSEAATAFIISGWMVLDSMDANDSKIYAFLVKEGRYLFFETANTPRPDVTSSQTQYLNMSGFNLDNSGFYAKIKTEGIDPGIYQAGICIINKDYAGSTVNKVVEIQDGKISIDPYSKKADIKVENTNRQVQGHFESINIPNDSKNTLIINGWGVLESMNANESNIYVALKKEDSYLLYNITSIPRPDVTRGQSQYLNMSGYDLDNSGLYSKINLEEISDGSYQVGMYIINGNNAGFLFSNTFVGVKKGLTASIFLK